MWSERYTNPARKKIGTPAASRSWFERRDRYFIASLTYWSVTTVE
jgi:hypothetical protein